VRAAGTARRRTGREREAFPVTDYGANQPPRPAYSLPVGGWVNENPDEGTGVFIFIKRKLERITL